MAKEGKDMAKTETVSLRIEPVTNQLWEDLAAVLGLSKVNVFEMAIRKLARTEGIPGRIVKVGIEPTKGNDSA
jgi:antitoxin component of RelBE/YafQ-DinJ toxin-antitoxin module